MFIGLILVHWGQRTVYAMPHFVGCEATGTRLQSIELHPRPCHGRLLPDRCCNWISVYGFSPSGAAGTSSIYPGSWSRGFSEGILFLEDVLQKMLWPISFTIGHTDALTISKWRCIIRPFASLRSMPLMSSLELKMTHYRQLSSPNLQPVWDHCSLVQ